MLKRSVLTISLATVLTATSALAFVNSSDNFSFGSSLIDAVDQNNIELVKLALQQGLDPNEAGKFDTTALDRAALKGNTDIANLLIASGADVNLRDYGGATPLSIAARAGSDGVVKTLVKKGADVNATDDQGYTALHRAIANRQKMVSRYLINIGANVNTVNNEGNSPLIDAVRISDPEIVRDLIIKGADKSVRNNKGQDVIAFALQAGNSQIDNMLSKSPQDLMRAANISSNNVTANNDVPLFMRNETNNSDGFADAQSNFVPQMGVNAIKVPTADVKIEMLAPPIDSLAKTNINDNAANAGMPASMAYKQQAFAAQNIQPMNIEPVAIQPEIQPLAAQTQGNQRGFEVADLQLTGQHTAREDIGLQRAPRLPANGTVPEFVKEETANLDEQSNQDAAEKAINNARQAEIKKAYQQGLQNIKPIELPANVEANPNSIKLDQTAPADQVVYNFNYQQPDVKQKKITKKRNVDDKIAALGMPASMQSDLKTNRLPIVQQTKVEENNIPVMPEKAGTVSFEQAQTNVMPQQEEIKAPEKIAEQPVKAPGIAPVEATQPVEAMQVASGQPDVPAQNANNNVAPQAQQAGENNSQYEAQVDQLMNGYAQTVQIDKVYEAQVDDLIKQLVYDQSTQTIMNAPARNGAEYTSETQSSDDNSFVPPEYPLSLMIRDVMEKKDQHNYTDEINRLMNQPKADIQPIAEGRVNIAVPTEDVNIQQIQPLDTQENVSPPQGQMQSYIQVEQPVTEIPRINLDSEAEKIGSTKTIMPEQPEQNNGIQNAENAPNDTAISDYNAYRKSLLRNISEFYNKDLTQNYKPYDISDLDRQRKQNINAATGDEEPLPPADDEPSAAK